MATNSEDPNRKLLDQILQTTWSISVGAAHKGLEMARNPEESINTLITHAQALTTVPAGTPDNLPDQAQALAGVWLEKGTTFVMECKATGEQNK